MAAGTADGLRKPPLGGSFLLTALSIAAVLATGVLASLGRRLKREAAVSPLTGIYGGY